MLDSSTGINDTNENMSGRRGQLGERDERVGGGMRGGQGDIVRNQRREQHKQRQHRLLNRAQGSRG